MKLRDADAVAVARQNAQKLEQERIAAHNTEAAKQERRLHNQRLAQRAIANWSSAEIAARVDQQFEAALAGTNDDPNFSADASQYRVQPVRALHHTITAAHEAQRRREARPDPYREIAKAVANAERGKI
jgi:hypothetical protein